MKFITVIIFITLVTESFAQFTKGDKVLGGSFSLYRSGSGEPENSVADFNKSVSFGLQPNFGILIKSNLEIGGLLGYTWQHSKNRYSSRTSDSESQYFTMGLYMQRYFSISEKFLFTLQGDAWYSVGKSFRKWDSQAGEETRDDRLSLILTPKFVFFPSANWGIHAGLGDISYTYSKESKSTTTSHSFDISYGNFILGISYYFRH